MQAHGEGCDNEGRSYQDEPRLEDSSLGVSHGSIILGADHMRMGARVSLATCTQDGVNECYGDFIAN